MGMHTGVTEQREGDYFGSAVNRATRLMRAAHPGQVLCSQATAELVRDALPPPLGLVDLGMHRLQNLTRTDVVFQITHPDLPADFPPLRSLVVLAGNLPRQATSFVGRQEELARVAKDSWTHRS